MSRKWARRHTKFRAETEESEEYVIEANELYSLCLPHKNALEFQRIMLPLSQRSKVIAEAHSDVGHRAVLAYKPYQNIIT